MEKDENRVCSTFSKSRDCLSHPSLPLPCTSLFAAHVGHSKNEQHREGMCCTRVCLFACIWRLLKNTSE